MKEGDFIEIEFVGRVRDTGEIFDLTDEEVAKKEGVFDKDHRYGPAVVVIGGKSVMPGVEQKLREMEVGEESVFELKPENAFGKRDPKLVQVVSVGKFYGQKINPVPGAFVNIDGRNCRIQSVSGGRVRVDFNHPLAGRDVLYKIKILKEITGLKEKTDAIIKQLGVDAEASVEGETAKIKLKKPNKIIEQIIEKSIMKLLKEVKAVKFEPEEKPEPQKK